jgi:hypothetical protein
MKKGYKFTLEQRKHLSEAHLGIKPKPEAARKTSIGRYAAKQRIRKNRVLLGTRLKALLILVEEKLPEGSKLMDLVCEVSQLLVASKLPTS